MYALHSTKSAVQTAADSVIRASAQKSGQNSVETTVIKSRNPALGDLSIPVFSLASAQKKTPQQIAEQLCNTKWPDVVAEAKAEGGFVNLYLSEIFFHAVLDEAADAQYGRQTPMGEVQRDEKNGNKTGKTLKKSAREEKGKEIKPTENPTILEYSQPNPGKPMHLGHIRSTIIGDVCANALDLLGRPVVRLNYLNDRGAHIAELITAMETFKDLPKVTDEKSLLAYYVKIKAEIEKDPALKEKTRQVLEHLKDHEKQLVKIREMSWVAFKRNYDALGVKFDDIPFETTLESDSRARVQECLDKGLAKQEPDGTIITQLEPELSNTVLLRSNGTPLYFTSDLALADWKWQKYPFSQSWIFTAAEQNLHFRQLQLLLTKMGRPFASRYGHKGHGLIRLTEGKLSTRAGRVILLEDIIHAVEEEAKTQMTARNPDAKDQPDSKSDLTIAKAVGIGALKYGVLKVKLEKDITFDPKAEVQFEGDTSAYIQYAHVRACAILEKFAAQAPGKEKAKNAKSSKNNPNAQNGPNLPTVPTKLDLNDSEKQLLLKLAEFPDVLEYVATTMQPHALCEYAISVAKAFTSFYAVSPVLTPENEDLKSQRLHIVASTKNVLALTLGVLGIDALEKM
ncbi:arginine--tRNA ligase [Candidatus Micrarchaeota archaeon]|nr:arginine--tRNA ligase [Candidatus Micrarchaeota archaeon]